MTWHTKYQKPTLISCSKSQKIWHISIVPSQIWNGTDINAKHCLAYLIHFFSLLLSFVSLRLQHISLCLAFSSSSLHTVLPRRETEIAQARHWSLTHFAMKRNSNVKDTVAESENFHQWRRQRRLSWSDCLSRKVTNTEGGEKKKKKVSVYV